MFHGAKSPWGEKSVGRKVRGAKSPWGEMSVGRNVRGAKCPWGKMSVGRKVLGAKGPYADDVLYDHWVDRSLNPVILSCSIFGSTDYDDNNLSFAMR